MPPLTNGVVAAAVVVGLVGVAFAVRAHHLPTPPPTVTSPFVYSFNTDGTLNETGSMQQSTSPYFWLDSGGEFIMQGGVGETMQGDAPDGNYWRTLYDKNNPLDTDQGLHPQNLFRLVTKSTWDNVSEQISLYIANDNFSTSPNRNESNGLLIMSRYTGDGQTLYYAGIRVDGTAVIKKKYQGTYYTMAQQKIFPGTYNGDQSKTNLIPHGQWITLRSDTQTSNEGVVTVTLYMQEAGGGGWQELLQASDDGQYAGTPPIIGPGYMGLRTDFMDVDMKNFRLETI